MFFEGLHILSRSAPYYSVSTTHPHQEGITRRAHPHKEGHPYILTALATAHPHQEGTSSQGGPSHQPS